MTDAIDEPSAVGPTEVEPTEVEPSDVPPRPSRMLPIAIAAALVFALLAGVMTVVAVQASDGAGADDRDGAGRLAGQFAEALYWIDYRDPDAYRDRLIALSTGAFETQYTKEEATLEVFYEQFTKLKLVQQGTVRSVMVSQIEDDSADAIVEVDIEGTRDTDPFVTPGIYVRLDLVKVSKGWRVDNVIDLGGGSRFGGAGSGSPTTSTTAGTTTTAPPTTN
jgi:hypothetical protein